MKKDPSIYAFLDIHIPYRFGIYHVIILYFKKRAIGELIY